ncbi:MAG: hypothetical protein GXO21_05380 [Aquificae bacterium]|nr:hypothetical protein [Aquificota bacterium]
MGNRVFMENWIYSQQANIGKQDSVPLLRRDPTTIVGIRITVNHTNSGLDWSQIRPFHIANLMNSVRLVANGNKEIINLSLVDIIEQELFKGRHIYTSFNIADGDYTSSIFVPISFTSPIWAYNQTDLILPADLYSDLRLEYQFNGSVTKSTATGTFTINSATVEIMQVEYKRPLDYSKFGILKMFKENKGSLTTGVSEVDLQYDKIYTWLTFRSTDNESAYQDNIKRIRVKRSNIVYKDIDDQLAKIESRYYIDPDNRASISALRFINFIPRGKLSDSFKTFGFIDLKAELTMAWQSNLEVIYSELLSIADELKQ